MRPAQPYYIPPPPPPISDEDTDGENSQFENPQSEDHPSSIDMKHVKPPEAPPPTSPGEPPTKHAPQPHPHPASKKGTKRTQKSPKKKKVPPAKLRRSKRRKTTPTKDTNLPHSPQRKWNGGLHIRYDKKIDRFVCIKCGKQFRRKAATNNHYLCLLSNPKDSSTKKLKASLDLTFKETYLLGSNRPKKQPRKYQTKKTRARQQEQEESEAEEDEVEEEEEEDQAQERAEEQDGEQGEDEEHKREPGQEIFVGTVVPPPPADERGSQTEHFATLLLSQPSVSPPLKDRHDTSPSRVLPPMPPLEAVT